MLNVKLVTAYVPVPGNPRTAEDFGNLGEALGMVRSVPIKAFYNQVPQCWLSVFLQQQKFKPTCSAGEDPKKNSLPYHIVQHNKAEWLYAASMQDDKADVFVWVDYSIFSKPGVSKDVIEEFCEKIKANDLAIPGSWEKGAVYPDFPCLRFYDDVIVCPRSQVRPLDVAVKYQTKIQVAKTHNVEWFGNTLARIDMREALPIRWYKSGRDRGMFDNYGGINAEHGDTGEVGEPAQEHSLTE